ncbi:MAG: hypothetical protein D6725_15210, partial [Planctomycetota bacterium]
MERDATTSVSIVQPPWSDSSVSSQTTNAGETDGRRPAAGWHISPGPKPVLESADRPVPLAEFFRRDTPDHSTPTPRQPEIGPMAVWIPLVRNRSGWAAPPRSLRSGSPAAERTQRWTPEPVAAERVPGSIATEPQPRTRSASRTSAIRTVVSEAVAAALPQPRRPSWRPAGQTGQRPAPHGGSGSAGRWGPIGGSADRANGGAAIPSDELERDRRPSARSWVPSRRPPTERPLFRGAPASAAESCGTAVGRRDATHGPSQSPPPASAGTARLPSGGVRPESSGGADGERWIAESATDRNAVDEPLVLVLDEPSHPARVPKPLQPPARREAITFDELSRPVPASGVRSIDRAVPNARASGGSTPAQSHTSGTASHSSGAKSHAAEAAGRPSPGQAGAKKGGLVPSEPDRERLDHVSGMLIVAGRGATSPDRGDDPQRVPPEPGGETAGIRLVSQDAEARDPRVGRPHGQAAEDGERTDDDVETETGAAPPVIPTGADDRNEPEGGALRIDLLSTLKLTGANNLDIRLAAERLAQARAEYRLARVLWLPSLNAGVGYTKHEGQIQATAGRVLDVSRNAFFVGGGASFGGTPLAGAAGGPARLMVQLDLSDAIFRPLAARQRLQAARSLDDAAQWDHRHEAMVLYFELLAADRLVAVARRHTELAERLLARTEALARSGKIHVGELARVRAEHTRRQDAMARFLRQRTQAEAALVRHLHLDPGTHLRPAEEELLPLKWVDERLERSQLVAAAWRHRPDLRAQERRISADRHQWTQERWRPLIPNIYAAAAAGGFGGGIGARLPQVDGRADFDIGAVWELKHLGFGNAARREIAHRQLHRSQLAYQRRRDEIARAVIEASARVEELGRRLELARRRAEQAGETFRLS